MTDKDRALKNRLTFLTDHASTVLGGCPRNLGRFYPELFLHEEESRRATEIHKRTPVSYQDHP